MNGKNIKTRLVELWQNKPPLFVQKQLLLAFFCINITACNRKPVPSSSDQQLSVEQVPLRLQSLASTKPCNAYYQGLSGPVSIEMHISVRNNNHVQVTGKTNLPPGTKLQIEIIENRPDMEFGPGDKVKVTEECTFQTRWISGRGNSFRDGRYKVKVLMPLHSVQPAIVQAYFGDEGSLLTGPLVEQLNIGDVSGKVVRASTEFVIGKPDDARVVLEVDQEKKLVTKWARNVSEFKKALREIPTLSSFRRNKAIIESMEADYLKEMEMIRQQSFRAAILSVMTDLRVMVQASDSAEFNLQLDEYRRSLSHLDQLMKNAQYAY
jgi:hypothetical protein